MRAREIYQINSHSDLCFMCFGKKSVYIANFLVAFVIFIVLILFLVLFAKVAMTIFATRVITEETSFLAYLLSQKQFYIIFLLIFQIPALLAKKFTDMTGQSKIMFTGIFMLVLVFVIKQF